eukprot:2482516-Amphidinium_carterae.1
MALACAAAVGGCGPKHNGQSKKVMTPVSAGRLLRFVTVACCFADSTARTASSTGTGSARLLRVSKRLPLLPTGNPR